MIDNQRTYKYFRYWWLLALAAIGLSALLAILLILSRTPLLQQWFDLNALFQTALVLHVDYSVLIWLLAFAASLWALQIRQERHENSLVDSIAFGMSLSGAVLLILTPLCVSAVPVMSNYIPVLQHPLFFTGLTAFAIGLMLAALRLIFLSRLNDMGSITLRASAIAFLLALWVFGISIVQYRNSENPAHHFEQMFWGGGHMLQFSYILLLQYGWLKLSNISENNNRLWLYASYLLFIPSIVGALIPLFYTPESDSYRELFTLLMRWGMLLILLPLILNINHLDLKNKNVLFALLLLLIGIVLGALIRADNVMVTAHYHATNGAITLTFMAFAYQLVEKFNASYISSVWSLIQLRLYAAAMLLYVGGMAWSGFLDIPRKSPVHIYGGMEQVAMGLMGLGGLVAIISTLLFFGICFVATRHTLFSNLPNGQCRES